MKPKVILTLFFAVLTALVDSSPLPQEPAPAPGGAPPPPDGAPPGGGGEKKIAVVGPTAGPWSVGSEQVATWWSTGFTADEPVAVITHEEGGTTPIFSQDSTLNKGSTQIPINDQYKPGTNYVTEVSLKSDPNTKGVGPTFTVTGGGGGPAAAPGPAGPPDTGPKGKEGGSPDEAGKGKEGGGPPPGKEGETPSGPPDEGKTGGGPPPGKEGETPSGPPGDGKTGPPPDAGGSPPPDAGGPPPPDAGGPPPPDGGPPKAK